MARTWHSEVFMASECFMVLCLSRGLSTGDVNIPNYFFFFSFCFLENRSTGRPAQFSWFKGSVPFSVSVKWCSCRKGLRVGSCLTLGNELSKETYELTKQKILLERYLGGE